MATHLSHRPTHHRTIFTQSTGNRLPLVSTALTGLALTALAYLNISDSDGSKKTQQSTPVAEAVCIPSDETQKFTFGAGQGRLDAVHAIQGSGNGEGDQCWDEARAIVEQQLISQDPHGSPSARYLQTITLPKSIGNETSSVDGPQ